MKILETKFVQGFIKMANDGYLQGWHERNGGNLSYRLKAEEVEMIRPRLNAPGEWTPIGTEVPGLAGEFFLVTGSGKYFRNIIVDPEVCLAIIELDDKGVNYRIRWGLVEGGRPTSELPTHLMNHEVKKKLTNGKHRVIYHAHTTNTIALTFVLPLDDKPLGFLLLFWLFGGFFLLLFFCFFRLLLFRQGPQGKAQEQPFSFGGKFLPMVMES